MSIYTLIMMVFHLESMKKDNCCVCGKETELYCSGCAEHNDDGTISPVCWFCDEHYTKVVMTGNCCYNNEKDYA